MADPPFGLGNTTVYVYIYSIYTLMRCVKYFRGASYTVWGGCYRADNPYTLFFAHCGCETGRDIYRVTISDEIIWHKIQYM